MPRTDAGPVPRRSSSWKRPTILAVCGIAVVTASLLARHYLGEPAADAQNRGFFGWGRSSKDKPKPVPTDTSSGDRQSRAEVRPERPQHDVMAIVNGKDINRQQLAQACAERYGEEVLESLVNKRLIMHHCRNRGIEVAQEEISAEIDRMAKRFKLGREQWLDLLDRERGINPQEYARDILWPTLALQKLAADQLVVSEVELAQAYEMNYGPAVRARLLVVSDRQQAEQFYRQLIERPEEFARLAMNHSEDVNSASIGGMIQPIRKHMGDPQIEQEVFSLEPGQISKVIPVAERFAILKCEEHIPPRNVRSEDVREELAEQIKEGKLRDVAGDLFARLQQSAVIQNIWNDAEMQQRMPGIVATVNGEQITMKQLGDECLLRYGEDVLEAEISHLLLQQALREQKLAVTQQDLDQEIAHAASLAGVVDEQGRPDFEEWFRITTEEQGTSKDVYLRDSVWPSAALKKLTGDVVQVTEEDFAKGFEANFGQRVECRAIVLHNMRKAMEVWGKARDNPSMDYFGDLATEYSIEPTSRGLRGKVPPIRRYGGQPLLEDAAFALEPGQLSEVIQLGDRFAILKCEGRTEPIEVRPDEVRQHLYQDILEKKLRIAMSERFEDIRSRARIDNYLVGTSQSPNKPQVDKQVRQASGTLSR